MKTTKETYGIVDLFHTLGLFHICVSPPSTDLVPGVGGVVGRQQEEVCSIVYKYSK